MIWKSAVAILVGAGRTNGVGAATAKLLAERGCNIFINTLKNKVQADSVAETCRSMGAEVEVYMGDVTKQSVCREIADFVKNRWGRADILVNSLGSTKVVAYENLNGLTEEDFAQIFSVNVTAPYLMAQAFSDLLKKSENGNIINVSSAAGISGKGSSIAYSAAKGAENTLTLALAQALAPEVRVNAVCPSFIDSSWWEEKFEGKEQKYQALVQSMREANVLQKVLRPLDVAMTILSIIDNPVMTGEIIRLDAGAHLGKANIPNSSSALKK